MTSIAAPTVSAWRFYPWVVAGSLALVMAVNFTMVYIALSTFPGEVAHDTAPRAAAPAR